MLQRLKKKAETGAITALIVIPLVVCVIAFLALACYFSLLSILSPALAAIVTAAAGIVLIAFVLLIARLSAPHSSKNPRKESLDAGEEFETFLRKHADPVLTQWVRDHPDKAALTTLLLGVAAGYSQAVRRVLLDTYLRRAESEDRRRGSRVDD
ncbi:MAG: hypothetical protein V2J42_09215 [Wenzhouxiangella sp.]|jgi:uncharacterized membrane protein required for colicin V production|nr:hypothetical protein [Wenzhouxiangella sp.]